MFRLRCTVRNCQHLLSYRDGGLFCEVGHHFDRAKSGYWNLLQPQDKKSGNPGDTADAVLARHRWLQRGYHRGLVEQLRPWRNLLHVDDSSQPGHPNGGTTGAPQTLDLGCGEGSFGLALFGTEADGYCGVDMSKTAIKLAVRSWPAATWVLANADRGLPATDGSVDRVISLFGRRPNAEISRVLKPGGICIIAVPGTQDLIELRRHVQETGHRRSRWERVVDQMNAADIKFVKHQSWQHRVLLDAAGVADAMAMTYRAVRKSQRIRLQSLPPELWVTLDAELLLFRKES